MFTINDWLQLLDYGVVAVALFMMYSITYNHLKAIQTTLDSIERILRSIYETRPI